MRFSNKFYKLTLSQWVQGNADGEVGKGGEAPRIPDPLEFGVGG